VQLLSSVEARSLGTVLCGNMYTIINALYLTVKGLNSGIIIDMIISASCGNYRQKQDN
jgi:hypothetical protein